MIKTFPYRSFASAQEAFASFKVLMTPEYIKNAVGGRPAQLEADEQNLVLKGTTKGGEIFFRFIENVLEIEINLSFLLRPLQGKIWKDLEAELQEIL